MCDEIQQVSLEQVVVMYICVCVRVCDYLIGLKKG